LDAIALARSGFRVTASDGSKSMVREAEERFRKAGLEITAKHAEWADLPLMVGGPFDLVLCIGNSIAHAGGEYAMTEALRRMRSALRPNGMFIVDSRNWEALHRTRPRIITGPRMRHKDGKKCTWIYIWSIPDEFPSVFRVEVVILFEQEDGEVTHESFALEFEPFSFGDLNHRLASAGFRILETTYHRDAPFYAILAQGGRR
jgi:SAM-dependent methyltransferase